MSALALLGSPALANAADQASIVHIVADDLATESNAPRAEHKTTQQNT